MSLLLSSCATQISEHRKTVSLGKESPKNCTELGDVQVVEVPDYGSVCDFTIVKNPIRNKAEGMGVNFVRLDSLQGNDNSCIGNGAAFKCPEK